MAEIISRKKTSHSLRVDLTPMVDLGFLLITFFVVTTSMTTPKALPLVMPTDGNETPVAESKTLNFVLKENDEVVFYNGNDKTNLYKSSFKNLKELRNFIIAKQQLIKQKFGNKNELVTIIKPTKNCSYKNIVDAVDEMKINSVAKYAIINANEIEEKL